jgi:phosphoribosyl 1,2-cyclic phosphodiesterase
MRMMTIASGSSGNCIYIGSDKTHILIDTGISRKKICEGLKKAELDVSDITAVLVTHEHSDHIKSLGVISRKDNIPIYTTKGTWEGICDANIGEIDESLFNCIIPDECFEMGDLTIRPFRVSHDANEPVAFRVDCEGKSMAVATDLGFYDDYIIDNLRGCNSMVIEANHDVNLLQVGSYPYYLKQRILSDHGHLSNEMSGKLIDKLLHDKCSNIFLGHLSKENNYDKLAYETVKCEIDLSDSEFKSKDFNISVAGRDMPSEVVCV